LQNEILKRGRKRFIFNEKNIFVGYFNGVREK